MRDQGQPEQEERKMEQLFLFKPPCDVKMFARKNAVFLLS